MQLIAVTLVKVKKSAQLELIHYYYYYYYCFKAVLSAEWDSYGILLPFTEYGMCRFTQPKLMHELLLVVGRKVNYFYATRLTDDDYDDDDDDDDDYDEISNVHFVVNGINSFVYLRF